MRLEGKSAIITGAGSGIGRAIAELFSREGAKVVVAELDAATGQETVAAIVAAGGSAIFHPTDVSNEADTQAMAQAALKAFGRIDILVNNAAAFIYGRIDEATTEAWQRVLAVNVLGPANCVRSVLPALRQAGGGSIVNIASVSSFIAQPEFVPYNTSKGAVLQLTRCLAMDLAKDKIRVNGICPGAIRTAATDRHVRRIGMDPEKAYAQFAADAVLNKMGQPIDIAYAALYLASDEASFVTGAHLVVDGGATID
jgi:NAD(P)-dependent dehydrogenase (short-subunit alcohol dehydrogenase family)